MLEFYDQIGEETNCTKLFQQLIRTCGSVSSRSEGQAQVVTSSSCAQVQPGLEHVTDTDSSYISALVYSLQRRKEQLCENRRCSTRHRMKLSEHDSNADALTDRGLPCERTH